MKRVLLCVLLTLSMSVSAFALEVPTDTVVQNLNGSQQAIKTFTIPANQDPQSLIEEPFELEGYLYTFADIVKEENMVDESKSHTETITLETDTDDLAKILGQLDRNDMSYVPPTTVKNGRTLSLANVEWQVTGTDLVGETLMPSSYQAVATYSARASYQAATGYVTTAEYTGDVTHEGVESVTYVLTYLGTKGGVKGGIGQAFSNVGRFFAANWLALLVGAVLAAAVIFGILYVSYVRRHRADVPVDAEYETADDSENAEDSE